MMDGFNRVAITQSSQNPHWVQFDAAEKDKRHVPRVSRRQESRQTPWARAAKRGKGAAQKLSRSHRKKSGNLQAGKHRWNEEPMATQAAENRARKLEKM